MLKNEFEKLVGYEVSDSEYRVIECCYMAAGDDIQKEQFCKEWNEHFKDSKMFMRIADCLTDERSQALLGQKMAEERLGKMESQLCEFGLKWDNECEEVVELKPYERIQTFDDACEATGMQWKNEYENLLPEDVVVYMKLRVIVAAINGLTKETLNEFPTFEKDEERYEVYYWLSRREWKDLDDDDKKRVVGRASYNASASGGCVFASAYDASTSSLSYTSNGARLALKDYERCMYCAKQFAGLWMKYFTGLELMDVEGKKISFK